MRLIRVRGSSARGALEAVRARFGKDALVLEVTRRGEEVEAVVAADTEAPRAVSVEDPMARSLRVRLERAGFLGSVARSLAAAADGRFDTMTALRDAVASRVAMRDLLRSREPIVLFGAPGAGKTTAAAMLAAHAGLIAHRKVLLVEAGGVTRPHPLLAACAKLLKGRHVVAPTTESLVRTASSADGFLVVVDWNGCRPLADGAGDEMRRLAASLWGAKSVLVADASAPLLLQAQVRALGRSLLSGVGLTRIDLAGMQLAPSLSAMLEHGAHPAFFTSGREIPQSFQPSTPESFARLVLTSVQAPSAARPDFDHGLAAARESSHA